MSSGRLLPARIDHRPPRRLGDRRASWRPAAWELIVVGELGHGRFLATHSQSGRSYRMDVGTLAEAEAEVAYLNGATLDITA